MNLFLEILHLRNLLALSRQQTAIYIEKLDEAKNDFERLFKENVRLKEEIRSLKNNDGPIPLYQSSIWTPTIIERSKFTGRQKYKIAMCKDLPNCPRDAQCTFAHSDEELKHYRSIYYRPF